MNDKPNKPKPEIFPLNPIDVIDRIEYRKDDFLFEEGLAEIPNSAQEPNRSFVGQIIGRRRFAAGAAIAIFVLAIFIMRTGYLQIAEGKEYRALAEQNRIRIHTIPSERGIIYDRNEVILAENVPTFNIITSLAELPSENYERQELIDALSAITGIPKADIENSISVSKDEFEQIQVAEDISYEAAMMLKSNPDSYQGLNLEVSTRRSYITDSIPSLSHVLGYTGIISAIEYEELGDSGYRRFDRIGKQGLEGMYEPLLRGEFGEEAIEVDALGDPERVMSKRDAVDGENMTLTIDSDLQAYIEEVLLARMTGTGASKASVIVNDPNNGEILALVSWPAFDANDFTSGIDEEVYRGLINNEDLPLFNRAIAGEFPSGSTIKPVYAAAALMEGVINSSTSFVSTGGLRIGVWFFPDWRAGGHGVTNVYHAIADSVNTFFYIIGGGYEQFEGLGIDRMMEYAALFGFGSSTGIDLPGEADGFLPSKEWKLMEKGELWYIGDTYHAAIGQGDFLVTPLQIAISTSVFANGGCLPVPHLNIELYLECVEIVPDNTVQIVRDAMRQTVTYGSATSMQIVPVAVAGKTGTAQWSSIKANHSWFTGFAPFDNPEVAITVLIEEGGNNYTAIPVARDILMYIFSNVETE
ncbi:MAG: penicillin-binding protein 2 [bacterium]